MPKVSVLRRRLTKICISVMWEVRAFRSSAPKDLKEERSRSVNGSVDWYHYFGDFQVNMLLEGFYTKLTDPFVLTAPVESENGSLVQTRINGSGAKVYGCTLEGKIALEDKVQLQAGLTLTTKYI